MPCPCLTPRQAQALVHFLLQVHLLVQVHLLALALVPSLAHLLLVLQHGHLESHALGGADHQLDLAKLQLCQCQTVGHFLATRLSKMKHSYKIQTFFSRPGLSQFGKLGSVGSWLPKCEQGNDDEMVRVHRVRKLDSRSHRPNK